MPLHCLMARRQRHGLPRGLVWLLAALLIGFLWQRLRRRAPEGAVGLEQNERSQGERALPERVSLNGASLDELRTLPGVGPVLAARIAAARPYRSVEALLEVEGIGEVTFAALAPRLEL